MPFVRICAAALAALLATSPVEAEDTISLDIITATAGEWLVTPEDGSQGCRVNLGSSATIGGYEIDLDPSCGAAVPAIADAAAWRFAPDGGVAFADALRKTILTFTEQEDATLITAGEPGKRLQLLKAKPGITAAPNAKDLFGPWFMVRPTGESVCMISLSDKPPPAGQESYGLNVRSPCDAGVTKLKLVSWRIEGLSLMLLGSDGASLAFEPDGKGGYSKDAREGGKPLLLVRPRK